MRVLTAIVLIFAIAAGAIAAYYSLDGRESPISSNNIAYNANGRKTEKTEKERFLALSSCEYETEGKKLLPALIDDYYVDSDYEDIFRVGGGKVEKAENAQTVGFSLFINGGDRNVTVKYITRGGRTMGYGSFAETLAVSGTYSRELKFECLLTDMPKSLASAENEMLVLVSYSEHGVYSDAFALDTSTLETRNLFPEKADFINPENYFITTDEMLKNSDKYFCYFSSKNYDFTRSYKLNLDEAKDLFVIENGEERFLAEKAHNDYAFVSDGGEVRFMRNSYSSVTYTIAGKEASTFTQRGFAVVSVNVETGVETVLSEFSDGYASNYRRDRDAIVSVSDRGVATVYDFKNAQRSEYGFDGVASLAGFYFEAGDVFVLGGSPTSVETGRQKLILNDFKNGRQTSVSGVNLFLLHEDAISVTTDGYLITVEFDNSVEKYTFRLTEIEAIFEEFSIGE